MPRAKAGAVLVSTHACSLMSRRRARCRRRRCAGRCFNPRLLVDEQATDAGGGAVVLDQVSTHACSLMSRRRRPADHPAQQPVSTHACSLMSRRRCCPAALRYRSCFNPRLLVDEQATSCDQRRLADPGFNPRLLVDEQATKVKRNVIRYLWFQPTPAR